MKKTTNLGLQLSGTDTEDLDQTFQEWRLQMNGEDVNSNMELIDQAYVAMENEMHNMQDRINGMVFSYQHSATLKVDKWSDAPPYTQTVSVDGVSITDHPIVDIDMSNIADQDPVSALESWARVGRISTANGSITAYCYEEKPEQDIAITFLVVKKGTSF